MTPSLPVPSSPCRPLGRRDDPARGVRARLHLLIVAGVAVASAGAHAQERIDPDRWSMHGRVYLWMPSIASQSTYPASTGGVSLGLEASDYLGALQLALMGSLEARRGRQGLLVDLIYLDFAADRAGTRDFGLSGPGGQISLPAGATGEVALRLRGWTGMAAASYRMSDSPSHEWQVLAGLRYLDIRSKANWQLRGNVAGLPAGAIAGQSAMHPDVLDVVAGARGRVRIAGGSWFVPWHADAGLGQSDLTWQASAGIGHAFGWGELSLVYRHLAWRFGDGSALRDLAFRGPALTAGFRW